MNLSAPENSDFAHQSYYLAAPDLQAQIIQHYVT
jgi:hypothetical protein